jgi:hypothetical protein
MHRAYIKFKRNHTDFLKLHIHSKYETEVDLDTLGITSEDWDKMSEPEKDKVMREIAI